MTMDSGESALYWWEFQCELRNRVWTEDVTARPLVLLRALVLNSGPLPPGLDPVIDLERERPAHERIGRGELLRVTVIIPGVDEPTITAWWSRFGEVLRTQSPHHELLTLSAPVRRSAADWRDGAPADGEVCLHFVTPLALGQGEDRRTWPFSRLRGEIERRLKRAFPGQSFALPERDLRGAPLDWKLERRLSHRSSSNAQHYRMTGFIGRYHVQGDLAEWWPWLKWAELLHLGKRIPFGLGRFRLEPSPTQHRMREALGAPALRHAYEQVVQHHDTASVEFAATMPSPFDPRAWCEALSERLRGGRFDPGIFDAIAIPKPNGGTRRIEQATFETLVVATHLLELLEPILDRQFEPQCYGFRKGLSRADAAEAIDIAIADGYGYVVETDIAEFFPSVPHDRLAHRLMDALPVAMHGLVPLILRLVAAPYRENGEVRSRHHGLPQGLPLSPLLANLYLDPLDEWIAAQDVRVVRYADDLVVLCHERSAAEMLLARLADQVHALQLDLAAKKTRVAPVRDGFDFLGYHFPRCADENVFRLPLRRPLHVVEPHLFLGIRGDAVELRHNGKVRDLIPLRRIDRILLHAPAALSTALIRRASGLADPVVIASGTADEGQTMLLTRQGHDHFEVATRQAQRHQQLTEATRDAIARDLVEAKVRNAMAWLRMRYRPELNLRFARLDELLQRLPTADGVDAVRGLEGMAAREVFAEINEQIEVPEFRFARRGRDERDRTNPLFNFGYWLLFQHLNLELRALGLNPYLGFLHRRTTGQLYESLVCDLQEPFRFVIDRLLVRLINLKALRPSQVDCDHPRPRIAREALHTLVQHFERELQRRLPGNHLTLSDALTAQCLNVRDFLVEGKSFHVFRMAEPRSTRPRSRVE